MDLIYTDANKVDRGVLGTHAFDLSFGDSENNFQMTLGSNEVVLDFGAFAYIEGTEYGGIIDIRKSQTTSDTITYKGRTWHGILNSKVIEPDPGENYYVVSGDANVVLATLVDRLGLSGLFVADNNSSGIVITPYQFHRYCKGYDGIRAMLAANGAKLKIAWKECAVHLSAEPIVDYSEAPIDGDIATLIVEQHRKKVNHLICLGQGNLAEREVIHLYADQFGNIGDVQYYTGIDEITDTYENTNAEDLESDGIKRFKELLNTDTAEITIPEDSILVYDIGDIVDASDVTSGVSVAAMVSQKIVKINNGVVSTEYKTGR